MTSVRPDPRSRSLFKRVFSKDSIPVLVTSKTFKKTRNVCRLIFLDLKFTCLKVTNLRLQLRIFLLQKKIAMLHSRHAIRSAKLIKKILEKESKASRTDQMQHGRSKNG